LTHARDRPHEPRFDEPSMGVTTLFPFLFSLFSIAYIFS